MTQTHTARRSAGRARPSHPAARHAGRRRFAAPSRIGLLVLGVGLAVTAALSWSSYVVHERNENRLLGLQTQEAATVLQAVIPALQTPLSSAAEIAATSAGDPARFRGYISSYVGATGSFASASLWRVSGGAPTLVTTSASLPN